MVKERMNSSECFQHWLVTQMASGHKNLRHQLPPHETMYFLYTFFSLLSFSCLKMTLKRVCNVLVCPERMHSSGTKDRVKTASRSTVSTTVNAVCDSVHLFLVLYLHEFPRSQNLLNKSFFLFHVFSLSGC